MSAELNARLRIPLSGIHCVSNQSPSREKENNSVREAPTIRSLFDDVASLVRVESLKHIASCINFPAGVADYINEEVDDEEDEFSRSAAPHVLLDRC